MNNNFLTKEELNKLSSEELNEKFDETSDYCREIRRLINYRMLDKYDYAGKFIKIRDIDRDVYMHVRMNFITDRRTPNEYSVCYQGHYFEYNFGEYTDDTWFTYSWWHDIDITINRLNNPSFITGEPYITEITEDEFKQKFNEGYSQLPIMFLQMIDNDKYQLNKDKEETNNGSEE